VTTAYIENLLRAYPNIEQVWLIGSRADSSATASSDWDYMIMADQRTLDDLVAAPHFNVSGVDLLVVYDGDNFRKPWPDGEREKHGSLMGWEWREVSAVEAVYKATKPREDDDFYSWVKQGRAVRLFPRFDITASGE
jgi:hypothetical protein